VLIVNSSGCISDGSTGNDAEAELAVVVEVVRTPELPEKVASPLKLAHVESVPVSASIIPNGVTAPEIAVIEEYDCRQAIIAQIGAAAPPLVLIFTSHNAGAEPATVETSGMVAGSVVEANVSSASRAFSGRISNVVIVLPTARHASASQSVEYPALVPISM
jgi:hypothetical protein